MVARGSSYCEFAAECGLGQNCPDLLSCDPPASCQELGGGFPDCPTQEGFGFDGTGCVEAIACVGLVYPTREACWQACERSCDDVALEVERFREENKGCQTAEDCTWVSSVTLPHDDCCVVALNQSANLTEWERLNEAYACFDPSPCCAALPGPLECVDGRCNRAP
jgi:hypothetical protein